MTNDKSSFSCKPFTSISVRAATTLRSAAAISRGWCNSSTSTSDDAHAVIITDANVDELYAEPVANALAEQGCEVDIADRRRRRAEQVDRRGRSSCGNACSKRGPIASRWSSRSAAAWWATWPGFVAATFARGLALRASADDAARTSRQLGRRQGRHQPAGREEHGRRVLAAARRADRRRRAAIAARARVSAPAWPKS